MRPRISYVLNFFLLTAAIVMLTPEPGLAEPGMLDVRLYCTPLEIHEGQPDEKACLKQFADKAARNGRDLTLNLKNGKTKVLSDAKECEDPDKEAECVTYRLEGYIADRYFIVAVAPYECGYMLLVNRRAGEETTLGGWPDLSPNRKRFIDTASFAAGECNRDYNIGIYSLAGDSPRLEWHFTADNDYEDYASDGWNGENRVRLRVSAEGKEDSATDLKLTAQGWQLKRPNGQMSLGTPASPTQVKSSGSMPQPSNPIVPGTPSGR